AKVLEGQELRAGQFEFVLVDEAGDVVQTVSNNANGQVIFDEIEYDEVGEYSYTLREVEGIQGGVTYDATEFEAIVTVTDDEEGQLHAAVEYNKEEVVFTNSYEAKDGLVTLEASKVLEGQELSAD